MEWRDVWRGLFPRRAVEQDVEDELRFHIEGRIRELVRQGMDEDDARADVLRRFGNVRSLEEACRIVGAQRVARERRRGTVEAVTRDLALAARTLKRNPGFTLTVIVTLAVGIGATTAVFSVLEAVVLRPLAFPEADRLAVVWQNDRATGTERERASTADYYDYVERSRTFQDLAMVYPGTAVLQREDAAALQLQATQVSRNLLSVLGIEPQLGRGFTEAEDRPDGPHAVMLTDAIWRDLFGADPTVIGTTVLIDQGMVGTGGAAVAHEVVGVLPPGLDFPSAETDVWLPIRQSPAIATRTNHWIRVLGRLGDDVALEAAQAEMSRIMADLEVEYPDDNVNRGAFVEPLADVGRGDARATLWALFAAVMAVLAIACVNVANLLLARGAGRAKELAVLTAVGAGAGDVHRRFFAEALLITGFAAAAGIGMAAMGNRALYGLAPGELQSLGQPELSLPVLTFALLLTAAICLAFGLLPTVQARRLDVQRELKDGRTSAGGRVSLAVRRTLVAAQLALAVSLLLGATLLIGTVRNLQRVDPGFRADQTLRLELVLPAGLYPETMATYPDWPEVNATIAALEEEVEAVPGVRSASVVMNHPLDAGFTNSFRIEGRPYDPTQGEMTTRLVSPSYFETARLEIVEGRALTDLDRVGSPPVILLNEEASDRYFPAGDALGSRIAFWGATYREVVGVVRNERVHGLTVAAPPAMYLSIAQAPPRGGAITLLARTDVPPLSVAEPVRDAIARVDARIPVFNTTTMEATVAEAMAGERFASTVLVIFAGVAVFLAILGVHGVLAYLVSQRGHEVGIRMALGASRQDVIRMVVRQGMTMTVLGIVAGFAVFLAGSGVLRSLLFGVSPTNPTIYVAVGGCLGLVAMLGSAVPALRAASIDPVRSLRAE